jgi:hypothetical protein
MRKFFEDQEIQVFYAVSRQVGCKRPTLPKVYGAGMTNSLVLNRRSSVRSSLEMSALLPVGRTSTRCSDCSAAMGLVFQRRLHQPRPPTGRVQLQVRFNRIQNGAQSAPMAAYAPDPITRGHRLGSRRRLYRRVSPLIPSCCPLRFRFHRVRGLFLIEA